MKTLEERPRLRVNLTTSRLREVSYVSTNDLLQFPANSQAPGGFPVSRTITPRRACASRDENIIAKITRDKNSRVKQSQEKWQSDPIIVRVTGFWFFAETL